MAHVCDMKSYFDENLKLIDEKNLYALFPKESQMCIRDSRRMATTAIHGSHKQWVQQHLQKPKR